MVFRSYLSPIFDYTDPAFRLLCQRHGADAVCVPLVNADAVVRGKLSDIDAHPAERNVGVQLVGGDPAALGRACGIIMEERPFVSWLNLNCGCPSSRTMDAGGGSALLARPERIVQAVEEMGKCADVPITVKLRIRDGLEGTAELCRGIEDAGADCIILHGRTPGQGYDGKTDWGLIGAVKAALTIPLVGNGDITSASEGRGRVLAGLCDSFMVGRAAMANPLLFEDREPEGLEGRFSLLQEYISIHQEHIGEPDLQQVRAKALNLVHGVRDACRIRDAISRAGSVDDLMALG